MCQVLRGAKRALARVLAQGSEELDYAAPGTESTRQMNGRPTDAGAPKAALASCPKENRGNAIEPRNLMCGRGTPLNRIIYCAVAKLAVVTIGNDAVHLVGLRRSLASY